MIWIQLSRSKGQGHHAALLSAALTRKVAAAVSVGTYSTWESTATLCLLSGARGAWAPTGEGEGWGILCHHVQHTHLDYMIHVHGGPTAPKMWMTGRNPGCHGLHVAHRPNCALRYMTSYAGHSAVHYHYVMFFYVPEQAN